MMNVIAGDWAATPMQQRQIILEAEAERWQRKWARREKEEKQKA